MQEIPTEEIAERERNPKGIVSIDIAGGITCDHSLPVYKDKEYNVLCYKKAEMVA